MSSGRPDFHPTMLLEGKHGTQLVPVLVDANGQLYIVMSGQAVAVTNLPADGSIARDMMGLDGVTHREVAVDASGIILARMQGAYGAILKDIAVDADGKMTAVMLGDYGGVLKTIAVNSTGVMKTDFFSQTLDFLRVRPVYGAIAVSTGSYVAPGGIVSHDLFNIAGRGAIAGGILYTSAVASSRYSLDFSIDGTKLINTTPYYLFLQGLFAPSEFPLYLGQYDTENNIYQIRLKSGSTFETSLSLTLHALDAMTIMWVVFYYLVPA